MTRRSKDSNDEKEGSASSGRRVSTALWFSNSPDNDVKLGYNNVVMTPTSRNRRMEEQVSSETLMHKLIVYCSKIYYDTGDQRICASHFFMQVLMPILPYCNQTVGLVDDNGNTILHVFFQYVLFPFDDGKGFGAVNFVSGK